MEKGKDNGYIPCLLLVINLSVTVLCQGQSFPLKLWYDRPARQWEETLPLGNGRLGMTPDGGVAEEKIVLNDITLWSGSPQDANNYDAYKSLPGIRQYLLEGKNDSAQALVDKSFICTGKGSGGVPFGCFQMLGNLHLQFAGDSAAKNYTRELSLDDAIARCSYQVGDVTYKREYFTSFGDDVDIIRLTADKGGKLNFRITMDRPERGATHVEGTELLLSGQLDNGTDGKGMNYLARVRTRLKGGTCVGDGQSLVVKDATEVLVYISAATDWKGFDYKEKTSAILKAVMVKPYEQEVKEHVRGYRRLYDRLSLRIGGVGASGGAVATVAGAASGATGAAGLPTDQRLTRFHEDPRADNGLPVLFFQFGRYLSISSTRVGLLPPNLQGLWANQIHTPWNGDYHLDINVEMNHWPVEVTNLSELNLPLADLVAGMVPHGEKTARAYYNAGGWVAHVITNPWGFTEPGESASWGVCKVGGGWLCDNLWQHYAFTEDTAYLEKIYPILKGAAVFYNDMLIEDPESGWLVTAPSSSPENWFIMPNGKHASICMGPTIDNQIIRQLFDNVITASRLLKKDGDFSRSLQEKLKRIPPAGIIAPDGRLQEWLKDYKEGDVHHRHVSHLYGLFPADLITPEKTPDLAEACRKTLDARGDDGPSWSIAYKMLWWARLHDGNRAWSILVDIMRPTLATHINYGAGGGIYPNLLSAGPPFQIDGNYGATAGVAEMLIQSHAGFIDLLPALPDAWKVSGEVKGLRARGNYTVDITWKNGKVTAYHVTTPQPRKVKVKVNGVVTEIWAKPDLPVEGAGALPYANYFTIRGGLEEFYREVAVRKTATVGFLGGSITFNPGWRDRVCDYLRIKFPGTTFRFIMAGIPSLGSLPHVFRVGRDLLDSGRIDLLFVETAVNDRVNGTDSLTQVRCLEGIVRHAKRRDPALDIVMMAFADPDKTADYDRGTIPVEVANQELVAGHYQFPSINIAREVRDKIRNGEFDWKKDFKDVHPSPFGQELYFANIRSLLDSSWEKYQAALGSGRGRSGSVPKESRRGQLPPPLDLANLDKGEYAGVDRARYETAWTLFPDWKPSDSAGTRPGFVHVPLLEGKTPGAELSLSFKGTAVGVALVSGPDAGIIEYRIDGGVYKQLDLYTQWSNWLHLPWYLLLGSALPDTKHVLTIRITPEKNKGSKGTACRIVHFLVNG